MKVFKPIPGFSNYLVSDSGVVVTRARRIRYVHAVTGKEHFRITKERPIKIYSTIQGYYFCQLYRNKQSFNKTIHRLVANAFLPYESGKPWINHKDGNKKNNHVSNLERCTRMQNVQHAMKNGLIATGERVGTSKLTTCSVLEIKKLLTNGVSHSEIANKFNVCKSTITLINTGETWKHVTPSPARS